jgi:hypothetical protein
MLVAKIAAKAPPPVVSKLIAVVLQRAAEVETALTQLAAPQAEYSKKLAARDAALLDWTKALTRLKRHATAAWADDVAIFNAVFAKPEAVQRPVAHRRKAKANGQTEVQVSD